MKTVIPFYYARIMIKEWGMTKEEFDEFYVIAEQVPLAPIIDRPQSMFNKRFYYD